MTRNDIGKQFYVAYHYFPLASRKIFVDSYRPLEGDRAAAFDSLRLAIRQLPVRSQLATYGVGIATWGGVMAGWGGLTAAEDVL